MVGWVVFAFFRVPKRPGVYRHFKSFSRNYSHTRRYLHPFKLDFTEEEKKKLAITFVLIYSRLVVRIWVFAYSAPQLHSSVYKGWLSCHGDSTAMILQKLDKRYHPFLLSFLHLKEPTALPILFFSTTAWIHMKSWCQMYFAYTADGFKKANRFFIQRTFFAV